MAGKRKYSDKQFAEAIKNSGGLITVIAKKVGCDWYTARDRINASDKLRTQWLSEKQATADLAQSKILDSIRMGNTQDAKWYLARMRPDEFGDKTQVTGEGGGEIILRIVKEDE